jgi:serine protease Do
MSHFIKSLFVLIALILIVGVGCSSGSAVTPTPQPEASPQPTQAQEPTQEPTAAPTEVMEPENKSVSTIQDVKQAVVQIEAQGTFVDPEFGLVPNAAGRGSGFIIDPSGLAVTNNHVVTGAALLKVWVGGEDEPRNARLVAASECSDLALIDIEGDGYPYLEWRQDPVDVGLDIYVAGFPLGDPEYTLTRGIISKARASGETSWSSVDSVLEYDANTNPGNSGGPVLDENAKVVAVHYAGNSSSRQAFGISEGVADSVIELLKNGNDVDSIGINGVAVVSDDGSLSGIWVSSVKSGSPADQAGVKPGDIITSMESLYLATDGSMADYCDILRSHNPTDVLSIEVLRYDTQEVLDGQLNGRTLETSFSFANELDQELGNDTGTTTGYSDYTLVTDDFGAIQMNVPVEWGDVDGSSWTSDGDVIGSAISAAASLDNYYNYWTEPGVFFGASNDLADLGGYVQLLDVTRDSFTGECNLDGRYDYEDVLYEGKYDLWTVCGGTDASYIVLSARPKEGQTDFLILVEIQIVSDADLDALDQILNSFEVVGTLP